MAEAKEQLRELEQLLVVAADMAAQTETFAADQKSVLEVVKNRRDKILNARSVLIRLFEISQVNIGAVSLVHSINIIRDVVAGLKSRDTSNVRSIIDDLDQIISQFSFITASGTHGSDEGWKEPPGKK